jgi:dTMP kinase
MMMTAARGKFITFEGIDGAGKTTHLAWFGQCIAEKLTAQGQHLVTTREPGGTPLGEALRDVLLHQQQQIHLETEALLMFAARREHLAQVIEPALARGDWVLCDRFTDATFAYQGGGRGLARDRLETLEHWVQGDLQPDLTVLFDVAPQTASARRSTVRAADRFERETEAFFERTRNEYLRRAQEAPQRFAVVDAALSIEQVRAQLQTILAAL